MTISIDNLSIQAPLSGAAPATPPADHVKVYADANGFLNTVDEAGDIHRAQLTDQELAAVSDYAEAVGLAEVGQVLTVGESGVEFRRVDDVVVDLALEAGEKITWADATPSVVASLHADEDGIITANTDTALRVTTVERITANGITAIVTNDPYADEPAIEIDDPDFIDYVNTNSYRGTAVTSVTGTHLLFTYQSGANYVVTYSDTSAVQIGEKLIWRNEHPKYLGPDDVAGMAQLKSLLGLDYIVGEVGDYPNLSAMAADGVTLAGNIGIVGTFSENSPLTFTNVVLIGLRSQLEEHRGNQSYTLADATITFNQPVSYVNMDLVNIRATFFQAVTQSTGRLWVKGSSVQVQNSITVSGHRPQIFLIDSHISMGDNDTVIVMTTDGIFKAENVSVAYRGNAILLDYRGTTPSIFLDNVRIVSSPGQQGPYTNPVIKLAPGYNFTTYRNEVRSVSNHTTIGFTYAPQIFGSITVGDTLNPVNCSFIGDAPTILVPTEGNYTNTLNGVTWPAIASPVHLGQTSIVTYTEAYGDIAETVVSLASFTLPQAKVALLRLTLSVTDGSANLSVLEHPYQSPSVSNYVQVTSMSGNASDYRDVWVTLGADREIKWSLATSDSPGIYIEYGIDLLMSM